MVESIKMKNKNKSTLRKELIEWLKKYHYWEIKSYEEQNKELKELVEGKYSHLFEAPIKPVYHGTKLKEAINKALDERTALVEGFLYEGGVVQIFADDGLGLS